jgi:glycosyltransferase involved in cell wall biosynthesis
VRILLATDAWSPQVNGVVRTWQQTIRELAAMGHEVEVLHPALGRTIAAPRYNEIRLALAPWRIVGRAMEQPFDAVHIATEGPIGFETRRRCESRGIPYTTSYHTQFPEYLKQYFGMPRRITWRFMRWFHGGARATLAPTKRVTDQLHAHGIAGAATWCRGVDTGLFRPIESGLFASLPRPIHLYAGRIAREKNIDAFIDAKLPGSKVVVGDGPERERLERAHPEIVFAGYRFGEELAAHYAAADLFVFPSRTDTFGIVMLEANACGLPVAAYPVTGPIDVVREGVNGALDEDLAVAAARALQVPRESCLAHARSQSWRRVAEVLLAHLAPIGPSGGIAPSHDPKNANAHPLSDANTGSVVSTRP